jgi:hypothetical protein
MVHPLEGRGARQLCRRLRPAWSRSLADTGQPDHGTDTVGSIRGAEQPATSQNPTFEMPKVPASFVIDV